jgi:hypothetical protein
MTPERVGHPEMHGQWLFCPHCKVGFDPGGRNHHPFFFEYENLACARSMSPSKRAAQ